MSALFLCLLDLSHKITSLRVTLPTKFNPHSLILCLYYLTTSSDISFNSYSHSHFFYPPYSHTHSIIFSSPWLHLSSLVTWLAVSSPTPHQFHYLHLHHSISIHSFINTPPPPRLMSDPYPHI